MDRRVALGVLAAVIIIGVAAVTVLASTPSARTPAERSLALWQHFPATAVPRPIVPLGLVDAPSPGFPSVNAKLAFVAGRFLLRTTLPAVPSSTRRYRLRSATSAVGLMKAGAGRGPSSPPPLAVRHVVLGTATFSTPIAATFSCPRGISISAGSSSQPQSWPSLGRGSSSRHPPTSTLTASPCLEAWEAAARRC